MGLGSGEINQDTAQEGEGLTAQGFNKYEGSVQYPWAPGHMGGQKGGSEYPLISPEASSTLTLLCFFFPLTKRFPKRDLICSPLAKPRYGCVRPHRKEDAASERPSPSPKLTRVKNSTSGQARIQALAPEWNGSPVSKEGKMRYNQGHVLAKALPPLLLEESRGRTGCCPRAHGQAHIVGK